MSVLAGSEDIHQTLPEAGALLDGKKMLGDSLRIRYLTSGRDLLRSEERKPATDIVVLADPDFNLVQNPPAASAASTMLARLERTRAAAQWRRGDRFDLHNLPPLPGTRQEAQDLGEMLPNVGLLLGPDATEHALLSLRAPGILHIATHGLFLDDETGGLGVRSPTRGFVETVAQAPDQPLLQAARVLAGAGSYQPPKDLLNGDQSDGLVTALELAGMDLFGTQLVVLATCNSGRGYMRPGQGVYGLRRALITAGAETVATSLWKIADEVTRDLMKEFYSALSRGLGRAEAMRQASAAIRDNDMHPEYAHPYYWASFVVIGSDLPLRR